MADASCLGSGDSDESQRPTHDSIEEELKNNGVIMTPAEAYFQKPSVETWMFWWWKTYLQSLHARAEPPGTPPRQSSRNEEKLLAPTPAKHSPRQEFSKEDRSVSWIPARESSSHSNNDRGVGIGATYLRSQELARENEKIKAQLKQLTDQASPRIAPSSNVRQKVQALELECTEAVMQNETLETQAKAAESEKDPLVTTPDPCMEIEETFVFDDQHITIGQQCKNIVPSSEYVTFYSASVDTDGLFSCIESGMQTDFHVDNVANASVDTDGLFSCMESGMQTDSHADNVAPKVCRQAKPKCKPLTVGYYPTLHVSKRSRARETTTNAYIPSEQTRAPRVWVGQPTLTVPVGPVLKTSHRTRTRATCSSDGGRDATAWDGSMSSIATFDGKPVRNSRRDLD